MVPMSCPTTAALSVSRPGHDGSDIRRLGLLVVSARRFRGSPHPAEIGHDHSVCRGEFSRERSPHVAGVAEAVNQHHGGAGPSGADEDVSSFQACNGSVVNVLGSEGSAPAAFVTSVTAAAATMTACLIIIDFWKVPRRGARLRRVRLGKGSIRYRLPKNQCTPVRNVNAPGVVIPSVSWK